MLLVLVLPPVASPDQGSSADVQHRPDHVPSLDPEKYPLRRLISSNPIPSLDASPYSAHGTPNDANPFPIPLANAAASSRAPLNA